MRKTHGEEQELTVTTYSASLMLLSVVSLSTFTAALLPLLFFYRYFHPHHSFGLGACLPQPLAGQHFHQAHLFAIQDTNV